MPVHGRQIAIASAMTLPFFSILSFGLLLILSSCSLKPGRLKSLHRNGIETSRSDVVIKRDSAGQDTIKAVYLGCGGVALARGKDIVLVDPFFSNQSIGRIGRSLVGKGGNKPTFRSDEKMIALGLEAMNEILQGSLPLAILSGHSHYDHLMDIPALYEHFKKDPRLLLTRTGLNIIHKIAEPEDVMLIDDHASTSSFTKEPVVITGDEGAICVWPILSEHNPHFRHVKFFDGRHTAPVEGPSQSYEKTSANLWLEGNTFSFLIDFLDESGAVEFRIFIQSSSCHPPAGLPPAEILAKRDVDLAFVGLGSYEFSPPYPCDLLSAVKPKNVVWVHWEDFFRPYHRKPKTLRGTDVPGFFQLPCVREYKNSGKILWPRAGIKVVY